MHFGTREKLDEILKKGEEGGRANRRRGRGSGGGAELAPSKEMDPFIMCTEVGEREGGRKRRRRSPPARSLLVPFDSSLGTDWERRGRGAPAAAASAVDAL